MCTWEMWFYHKHDLLRIREWVCGKEKKKKKQWEIISPGFHRNFMTFSLYQLHKGEMVNHAERRKMILKPKCSLTKPLEQKQSSANVSLFK